MKSFGAGAGAAFLSAWLLSLQPEQPIDTSGSSFHGQMSNHEYEELRQRQLRALRRKADAQHVLGMFGDSGLNEYLVLLGDRD